MNDFDEMSTANGLGEGNIEEEITISQEQAKEIMDSVEKLKVKKEEYKSSALRWQADFENYKRRNGSLRKDAIEDGQRELALAVLPALDNLERAIAASETDAQALKDGVAMIYRQLIDALSSFGIVQIDCVGKEFDPNIHNAVLSGACADGEKADSVQEELQKGYTQNEKTIRASMVKVSQ